VKAYIICFVLTIVSTFLAEKNFKNKRKVWGMFFSVMAIFIPSIISGVRQIGVGRDVNLYVTPVISRALNAQNLSAYLSGTSYVEKGYSLLIYFIVRMITSHVAFSLFCIQSSLSFS